MINGIPVQFLAAPNKLVEEAVESAQERDLEGISVRVIAPEYLAAIMIQVGRPKDLARYTEIKEVGALDEAKLVSILSRYNLKEPT